MPVLIGELEKITGSPSSVTQVMVRAHETRITGAALTTDELVPIPVDRQGRFEVPLRPGKAVLVLVHGGRVGEGERFPMLVEEGLGTITSAIKLASDRFDDYEINELEQAAADMLAHIDKAAVSATRAEVAHEGAQKEKVAAEEARSDAQSAAGTAATDAVQKADEKLSGYVTAAQGHARDAGKDAGRAENARQGAETIQRELPAKIGQELDTRVPSELDKHLPGELDERVPPKVAEVIGSDRVIYDAAAAAVVDAVDAAMPSKADTTYVDQQDQALSERIDEEKWSRGAARSNDADLIRGDGMEGVWNFGISGVNLPERLTGYVAFVEASYHKSANSTHQRAWSTNPYRQGEQYERSYWSGSWSEWEEIGSGSDEPHSPPTEWVQDLLYTTHLDTVTEDGIWRQHSTGSASPENGYPEDAGRGILQVVGITASEIHQTYSTQSGVWVRRIVSGEPTMWAKVNPTVEQYQITQNFQAGEEKIGINWSERDTRIDQMRQAVGRVHTGGKAAICLSFDHGTKNFKEFVLPALQERGLKSSLALNSQRLDPSFGHYASEGATWPEVKAWADSGVEITNHSRTHQGAIGETDTYREIVLGREELEAHIGRPVWTWRGHGYLAGDDHDYDGFGSSNGTPEGFYNTYAGKLLLSSHPMVTGGIKPPYDCFPLDGEIPIGPRGAWIDTPSQLETAKRNIQYAVDNKMRIYINCHPQFVEFNDEYITRQDLFDFFDFVKIFIDDGELVDLTFAEWAVADSGETVVTGGVDQAYVDHSIASLHRYSGTGFPEGKVTAPVGAIYTDTAATAGAVRWIKTAGTGNTGWKVEYGDTGWRKVGSALADVLESGDVFFRRRGDTVDIVAEWAKFIPAGSSQMPAGFRPFRNDAVPFYASAGLATPVAQLRITYAGRITINVFDDRYSSNDQGTLTTSDPWPSSLPGTPA